MQLHGPPQLSQSDQWCQENIPSGVANLGVEDDDQYDWEAVVEDECIGHETLSIPILMMILMIKVD